MNKNPFGVPIVAACISVCSSAIVVAAPSTITQSVTHNGETITLQLNKENLRGSNFEVLVQNSSGGYNTYTPVDERSYIGTVDEYPGAISCGILKDDGTFKGAVYFDRGLTWFTLGNNVTSKRGTDSESLTFSDAGILSAGRLANNPTTYEFDVAFDMDYAYYTARNSSVAACLEGVEFSLCANRALYMRDALLKPMAARIIIRADQTQNPYASGFTLAALKAEWNANETDADRDVVCGVNPSHNGGLAYVGVIGTSSAYSTNNCESDGSFDVVWRHELGHNWGLSHFVGGSPEGRAIMGGNQPARFSGPEVTGILDHRDSRLYKFDNIGTYTATNLPPYAALDPKRVEIEPGKVEYITIDPLANDFDANGHSLSLKSFEATSNLGYPVTRSIGTGANGQDELVCSTVGGSGFDYFSYTVEDSSGQTATGYVFIYAEGVTPPMWTETTDADTFVHRGEPWTNYGSYGAVALKNYGTSSYFTRTGWVHFDISGKSFGDTATIRFTLDSRDGDAGYIDVWGIVDGANGDELGTDWAESSITWYNAPVSPDFVEGSQTTYLGRFSPASSDSQFDFSTPELLDFLEADTNGEVTIILQRENSSQANFSLRSKEHPNGGGATLKTISSPVSGPYWGTDTFVRNGSYGGDNYGNEDHLAVKKDGSSYQREAYLRFDHTSANAMASSKTFLTLTPLTIQPGQTYRIRLVDDSGDSWAEQGMTYNNRPVGSGAGITFSADDLTLDTPYKIDVTELFSQVSNANGAATFHIEALTQISTSYTRFASREHATAAFRPSLEIIDYDPHDAYVRGGSYANNSYGSDSSLALKHDGNSSFDREFYLRRAYDWNNGQPVAIAQLTMTPIALSSGRTIRVRMLDDADDGWREDSITWNNRPYGTGLAVNISSNDLTQYQPYTVDVTSLLNQSINSNGVASFHVDDPGATANAYMAFASKENGTASYRPVLNVNPTAPVVSGDTISLEDPVQGNTVTTVVATSLDESEVPSYAITAGNSQGLFAIDSSTGEITVAVTPSTGQYQLTVEVVDGGVPALTDTATITIDVTQSQTPLPPVANDAAGSVSEGAVIGTPVLTVTATDSNTGDVLGYTITAGNGSGAFAIDSSTGEITTASVLNYEATSSYSLTVTVTDSSGLSDTAAVSISVTDVDESGLAGVQAWEEAVSNGTASVHTRTVPLAGNTTTTVDLSALSGSVSYEFLVDAEDLGQQVVHLLDAPGNSYRFEQWNNSSAMGLTDYGVYDYQFTAEPGQSVASPYGGLHHVVYAVDQSSSTIKLYIDGVHVGSFNMPQSDLIITSSSSVLGDTNMRDDSSPGIHAFAAYNSALTSSEIEDHYNAWIGNQSPVIVGGSATVAEDAAVETVVGAVTADDVNPGDTVAYSITSGNTGGAFAIDSTTGEISVATQLDYETTTSYTLTVAATDGGGLSDTATFAVTVTDVFEDVDSDNMDDAWEIANFGDTTSSDGTGDADNDGLSDAEEYVTGSDPNSQDSDNDGFVDVLEVNAGTDPADNQSQPDSTYSGLVSWWDLDEGQGATTVLDDSGNAHHATVNGVTLSGGEASFDGVDDNIIAGTGPAILGTGDYTVSMWMKTAPGFNADSTLIQQRDPGSTGYQGEYMLNVKADGTLWYFIYNSGYQVNLTTTATVNDGQWHHVLAVRSGTTVTVYIDGVQAAQGTGTAKELLSRTVTIGYDHRDSNRHFNGSIKDVRIYDRAVNINEF